MNATKAIEFLATLLALPDTPRIGSAPVAGVETKAQIIATAQAAGIDTTSFVPGDPTERFLDQGARWMAAWGVVPTAAVRAVFFALSTDPGDVDDFGVPDQSADQTPRAGMLSAFGLGSTGTTRGEKAYATCFVTFTNATSVASSAFKAGELTFTLDPLATPRADGGLPTYVNVADPTIYTGIGGTLVLAPGATVQIPVQCEQLGTYGSAALNEISVLVTQSFGALTVTASTTAIGRDREGRALYIARCMNASAKLSPGGPGAAYRYAMNTARDGTVLQRFDGTGDVTITQAYVSADNATGVVTIYFGGDDGAVDSIDVSSANANIVGITVADPVSGEIHNADPIGVLPDGIIPGPTTSDPNLPAGTPGGASCTNDPMPIHYTARIKSSAAESATAGLYATPRIISTPYIIGQKYSNSGGKIYVCVTAGTSSSGAGPTTTGSGIADGSAVFDYSAAGVTPGTTVIGIFDAIEAALGAFLLSGGIGGFDQTAGAGVIYTADLPPAISGAQAGLYDPIVVKPSASSTAVALGHVATGGTITGLLTIV